MQFGICHRALPYINHMVACFLVSMLSQTAAHAEKAAIFDIDGSDLNGVIVSDSGIFLNVGLAYANKNRTDHSKVIRFGKSGGGNKCVKFTQVDAGIIWKINTCASVNKESDGSYMIKISSDFDFGKTDDANIKILMNYGFSRSTRQVVQFEYDSSSCAAALLSSESLPLNGGGWRSGRGGEGLKCTKGSR